jgi:hypothetical protein
MIDNFDLSKKKLFEVSPGNLAEEEPFTVVPAQALDNQC